MTTFKSCRGWFSLPDLLHLNLYQMIIYLGYLLKIDLQLILW
jgi:hypothetical protein